MPIGIALATAGGITIGIITTVKAQPKL